MITLTKFYARSFDLDHVDIFWEIADYKGNINQFEFTLSRSESSEGPWEPLAAPFKDQYLFRDVSPSIMHKWRTLYYRLEIRDVLTDERIEAGVTGQMPEPDLIALEIMRQEDILLREHTGRRCWLFPVRTFGAVCVCTDRVTGRRTKSGCLNCYDVGFLGGYFSPIEFFMQFDAGGGDSSQNTPFGEKQPSQSNGRLISFPPLKPKDIVVEAENIRWRVLEAGGTQRLRAVVHQEVSLHEVPRTDVVYKLPINIANIQTLQISSERNFTNPQHVDAKPTEVDDLLAVYGYAPRGNQR